MKNKAALIGALCLWPSFLNAALPVSAQQMGQICSGDCNANKDACGGSKANGGSICVSHFYHHSICVSASVGTCVSASLDCYDYSYYTTGSCTSGYSDLIAVVPHNVLCCGI